MTEKRKIKATKIYDFFLDQLQKEKRVPRISELQKIDFFLKKKLFTIKQLKQAIINVSESRWWMDNFGDKGIDWFFKDPKRVQKLLNLKSLACCEQTLNRFTPFFINSYNWCVRLYFQSYSDYHQFISDKDDGIIRAVDFINHNKQDLSRRVHDNLKLRFNKNISLSMKEVIFLYIISGFINREFPPPLYYFYSEGLLLDFQYDRIIQTFELFREWKVLENMNIDDQPKPFKTERKKNYVDSVCNDMAEHCKDWFSGK